MEENKAGITENNVETPETKPAVDYEKMYRDAQAELEKSKAAVTKANGEAANYKRQLSERMTAEENDRMQREENEKKILEELQTLRNEKRVSGYTTKLMACGIGAEDAGSLSIDLPDGIPDQFFDGIKKFIADETARIRADLLKEQPKLSTGTPVTSQDVNKPKDDALRRAFGFKQ